MIFIKTILYLLLGQTDFGFIIVFQEKSHFEHSLFFENEKNHEFASMIFFHRQWLMT
jgi:hypothetical protein